MKAVLDKLASLEGKPIETLSPEEAREQPLPTDAVQKLMKDQGKKGPEPVDKVEDTSVTVGDHQVKVRVYTPKGDGPFPVILYIHGGGWVIADLDTYDAAPRGSGQCGRSGCGLNRLSARTRTQVSGSP
jgi:acetyl esterase